MTADKLHARGPRSGRDGRRLTILALMAALGPIGDDFARPAAEAVTAAQAQAGSPIGGAAVPDEEPSRVLVAPLGAGGPAADDPLSQVMGCLPQLLAEAISADRRLTAALAYDLSPDTLEAMGLGSGADLPIPDPATLAAPGSAKALMEEGSVRVLVLPSVETAAADARKTIQLTIRWMDLVAGKDGSVSGKAPDAVGLIDVAGRSARALKQAWSEGWKVEGVAPGTAGAPPSAQNLGEITSKIPAALQLWARAGSAWNRGDVPAAEAALKAAFGADPAFDRAKVDLAWIRLAQGRTKEAAEQAGTASKGKRLSWAARALADVIRAAASGNPAALETVAARLDKESPSAPWGPLAAGLALNQKGEHYRAIAPLDSIRLHRPNDPAILHQAGMAALGQQDFDEAQEHLGRAAALWPAHDRIQMDLAESKVRAHDLEGARKTLEAWGQRYRAGDPPIWGGAYSYEDPPPIVRSQAVTLLTGSVTKAIESLDKQETLLEAASAPVPLRLILLRTMYELQSELAFGEEIPKHRWLNAARDSLNRLKDLTPPAEQKSRPWVLLRIEALLRVREGRVPEAKQIRERIAAASALPGFDPVALAEVDAAIALKEADTEKVFEARKRSVEARGSIEDLYELGQAYGVVGKWKEAEELVGKIEDRLETWSAARRTDAMLWSARSAVLVPFIYSLGGETGVWLGNPDASRKRFNIFLGYFKAPDDPFKPYAREAFDRGATPAW